MSNDRHIEFAGAPAAAASAFLIGSVMSDRDRLLAALNAFEVTLQSLARPRDGGPPDCEKTERKLRRVVAWHRAEISALVELTLDPPKLRFAFRDRFAEFCAALLPPLDACYLASGILSD